MTTPPGNITAVHLDNDGLQRASFTACDQSRDSTRHLAPDCLLDPMDLSYSLSADVPSAELLGALDDEDLFMMATEVASGTNAKETSEEAVVA